MVISRSQYSLVLLSEQTCNVVVNGVQINIVVRMSLS